MSNSKHNTKYRITASAPLLRPGLTIEAGPVSERYVVETVSRLMGFVRSIAQKEEEKEHA